MTSLTKGVPKRSGWASRGGKGARRWAGRAALLAAVLTIAGVLFWPGHTPPITDAAGRPVPGSVAALEPVALGGVKQWVVMRGHSARLPVLLFLSGGPGGTELGWLRRHQAALERHFLVVVWEQRGAGKSYPLTLTDRSRMTPEQYVSDGLELVAYLRRRFRQDKVFVMGHSWGSFLGVWLVQRRPEWFHAYVGVGQMTSALEDDRVGYAYVLGRAQRDGDVALVARLARNGPPPYYGALILKRYLDYLGPLGALEHQRVARAGGGGGNTFGEMVRTPELRGIDKLYAFAGLVHTFNVVYPQLNAPPVDLAETATDFGVPVVFLSGRHDLNAMASLSARYFRRIRAPYKELVWFGRSGHNPLYGSESDRFTRVLVERVLPLAGRPGTAEVGVGR